MAQSLGVRSIKGATVAVGLAAMASAALPGTARACGADPYLGMICMTAGSYCPKGYVEAKGQLLAIAQFQAVFAVVGTYYGGDGVTTFGVPDLQGRVPLGLGNGAGLTPVTPGQKRGAESTVMTEAQMPNHTHQAQGALAAGGVETTVAASASSASSATPTEGAHLAAIAGKASAYLEGDPGTTVNLGGVTTTSTGGAVTVTVAHTGGGQGFSIVDPSLGVRFCMAVTGLFPPRN